MAKDKELADHERAHNGKPGMKVRHGADATGKVYKDKGFHLPNSLINHLSDGKSGNVLISGPDSSRSIYVDYHDDGTMTDMKTGKKISSSSEAKRG